VSRPRDALGRPLGPTADPSLAVPAVPLLEPLSDDDAWALAMAYLAANRPFHAHEVFEMRWRQAPAAERAAWRALAQWGAALTHAARGNAVGARRLAERALETLDLADHRPACIDVVLVTSSCQEIAYGS
jgi:hypothetical protein